MLDELIEHLMCGFLPGLAREMGIGYHVESRITYHSLGSLGDGKNTLLAPEDRRINYHVYNNSSNSLYVADSSNPATKEHFTTQISGHSEYQPPNDMHPYTGEVTFCLAVAGSGYLMVTEYILVKDK